MKMDVCFRFTFPFNIPKSFDPMGMPPIEFDSDPCSMEWCISGPSNQYCLEKLLRLMPDWVRDAADFLGEALDSTPGDIFSMNAGLFSMFSFADEIVNDYVYKSGYIDVPGFCVVAPPAPPTPQSPPPPSPPPMPPPPPKVPPSPPPPMWGFNMKVGPTTFAPFGNDCCYGGLLFNVSGEVEFNAVTGRPEPPPRRLYNGTYVASSSSPSPPPDLLQGAIADLESLTYGGTWGFVKGTLRHPGGWTVNCGLFANQFYTPAFEGSFEFGRQSVEADVYWHMRAQFVLNHTLKIGDWITIESVPAIEHKPMRFEGGPRLLLALNKTDDGRLKSIFNVAGSVRLDITGVVNFPLLHVRGDMVSTTNEQAQVASGAATNMSGTNISSGTVSDTGEVTSLSTSGGTVHLSVETLEPWTVFESPVCAT